MHLFPKPPRLPKKVNKEKGNLVKVHLDKAPQAKDNLVNNNPDKAHKQPKHRLLLKLLKP
jgi:hypothetical protein